MGKLCGVAQNNGSGLVVAGLSGVIQGTVEQILERNGEYVLAVKRNQPILRNSIKALFADADGSFPPHHVTFDRGHGRDETRSITCTPHVADLNFPGVYQAWAITREALDLDARTVEIRGTVVRIKGQGLRIKPKPKSRAGYRKLQLPSWVVEMLRRRRIEGTANEWDVVFTSPTGLLRDPSNTQPTYGTSSPDWAIHG